MKKEKTKCSNIPSVRFIEIAKFWVYQRAQLILHWFRLHSQCIAFHDEKAYNFLNVFQLKSQSFVIILLPNRRSSFSPFFSDPRLPTSFISGFCLSSKEKRRRKERKKKQRKREGKIDTCRFFSCNYIAVCSKELETFAHRFLPYAFRLSTRLHIYIY